MSTPPPSKDTPPSTPPPTDAQLALLKQYTPDQIKVLNAARGYFQDLCGIRPAWLDAKETAADMKEAPMQDASPMMGVSNFAQYTSGPTYYFLSEPSLVEQVIMARCTAVGKRVTWGLSLDSWNNKFSLRYFKADGTPIDTKEALQRNADLHKHLMKVKYYKAYFKADGYDGELGESLVFIHRQGESFTDDYLMRPANTQLTVTRFEAVSRVDYMIDYVESFGAPHVYRITFRGTGGKMVTYNVHPSHCIRVKTDDIDYDQYKGQSRLKAVFPDITVLVLISKAGADLMNRIGAGKPVVSAPGIRSKEDLTRIKNMIGNVTQQEWIVKPIEVTLELLSGTAEMGDLMMVANLYYNNVCMATQIPRTILMGENLGVYGGDVPQAEYYNVLDRHHGIMEDFCREGLELDPWFVTWIGDLTYEFDWGLRHVMSQAEEIDYNTKVLTVMGEAHGINFSSNAIRAMGKFPSFEDEYKDLEDEKFEEIFFGITKKQMGNLPGKFFTGLIDAAVQTYIMAAQAQMGGVDLEEDVPGSAGGKAKPPLPSKGQANPHEVQGNSMPKDQRPKAALPEGELRREKVADAIDMTDSEAVAESWADEISAAITEFDDMPGMRAKLIDKMPISNGTMYKFFDWALERERKKKLEAAPA